MTSQPCSNITIHNGDCLEFIKTMGAGTVDIVLTDPPYGMKYRSAWRSCKYDEIKNDDSTDFLDDLIPELNRVMKSDSVLYMFCSHHQIDRFKQAIEKQLKIKNLLVWIKNNHTSGDLKGAFGNRTEFCFMAVKGTPVIQGKRPDNCLFYPRTDNSLHPTQKPVDMLNFMTSKFRVLGGFYLTHLWDLVVLVWRHYSRA